MGAPALGGGHGLRETLRHQQRMAKKYGTGDDLSQEERIKRNHMKMAGEAARQKRAMYAQINRRLKGLR